MHHEVGYVRADLDDSDASSGGQDPPAGHRFWSGLAVIVGITIGSGSFRKPHTLARDVGDAAAFVFG